jgi:hypothetical protein
MEARMSWQPRKIPKRTLAGVLVTYHAVDSYLRRVPGAHFDSARRDLADLAETATYIGTNPTGEEVWRADADGCALRLIVHRVARRPPMLLTVIPWGVS